MGELPWKDPMPRRALELASEDTLRFSCLTGLHEGPMMIVGLHP
jgi:hypothetical protein